MVSLTADSDSQLDSRRLALAVTKFIGQVLAESYVQEQTRFRVSRFSVSVTRLLWNLHNMTKKVTFSVHGKIDLGL